MPDRKLIEQEVLHEIAMAIGTSLDLDMMLQECIPVLVRGLGCCTAAVLLQDSECRFYTPHLILPKAAIRNRDLHQAMAIAIDLQTAEQMRQGALPIEESLHHYYAWPLGSNGLLILGRSSEFHHTLYMEMTPLAEKLSFALDACLRYQRLQLTQAAISQARDNAELANRAKSYFLATMSHEIRTPLNAVINFSQMLAETPLQSHQLQLLQGVIEAGHSLLQLVDDVMDFSRIEAGKLELASEAFSLQKLLQDISAVYGKLAAEGGLRFDTHIAPGLPDSVLGDEARVRQILQNLLSNAIKFTQQGYVTVRVTREPSGDRFCFSVADSGLGMDASEQAHLLAAFSQHDGGLSHHSGGGTGLGLAIVARLVHAMGGELGFSSNKGEGSCFWLLLPMEAVSVPSATLSASLPPPCFNRHILLVEDSPTNQMVASSLLQKAGCHVDVVDNGMSAVEFLRGQMVDLVLMDVSMPQMDGLEATRRIRALGEVYDQLPIVAMTAHALQQDRAQCLAAGMNDYLTKPLQRERFYEMLDRWLQPQSSEMTLTVPPASSSPEITAKTTQSEWGLLIDEAQLHRLRQETSPGVFLQVMTLFDVEAKQHMQGLMRALAAGALEEAAREAHAIKSSAGSLGAQRIYRLSAAIEMACRQNESPPWGLVEQLDSVLASTLRQLQQHAQASQAH
ncbi:response regulator [Pseudaeromonas sharmana]|uniref:histidine kinase n=1 Tax=Pseudaeromonas sharmana TaxID=328412 RepID=A0ABV8CQE8_9GAMM